MKTHIKKIVLAVASVFSFLNLTSGAQAFTGKELMATFSRDERHMYLTALIHMASYQAVLDGDKLRGQCIMDWYHAPDHLKSAAYIERFLQEYPDKEAAPIVVVLINRECGKPSEGKSGP
ncbi:MAG: hypothetical protein AAGD92_03235 [Pseudomonadota bacterium]